MFFLLNLVEIFLILSIFFFVVSGVSCVRMFCNTKWTWNETMRWHKVVFFIRSIVPLPIWCSIRCSKQSTYRQMNSTFNWLLHTIFVRVWMWAVVYIYDDDAVVHKTSIISDWNDKLVESIETHGPQYFCSVQTQNNVYIPYKSKIKRNGFFLTAVTSCNVIKNDSVFTVFTAHKRTHFNRLRTIPYAKSQIQTYNWMCMVFRVTLIIYECAYILDWIDFDLNIHI